MLQYRHWVLEHLGRQPILVYTMGKVGSTTVYHAFKQQYIFPLTYHVHHFTSEYLDGLVKLYERGNFKTVGKVSLNNLLRGNSNHLSASYVLREVYSKKSDRKWNIITLVRDPFSTYLSRLFQNPKIHRPYLLGDDGLINRDKVENHIRDYFLNFQPENDYITNWFDREFLKFTEVDLYKYPFNTEKGYSIIREKKFNIAILCLERLNENLPKIINEFAHTAKEFSISKKNVRRKDDDTGFYKDLISELKVPREGLEKFYSTK